MTYTPEELEAYRQDVHEDGVDNGHMAVIFLDALDVIKKLQADYKTADAERRVVVDVAASLTEKNKELHTQLEKIQKGLSLLANTPIGTANREIIEPHLIGSHGYLVNEVKLLRGMAEPGGQEKFLLHLVDVVWGDAMEDGQVPSTPHALNLIERAKATLDD